jgi:hypothetical protein
MPDIDFYALEEHHAEHLVPIWNAMPAEERGDFIRGDICPPAARPVVVASYGDYNRARGRRRILCQHGAGQSYSSGNPSYPGGRGLDNALAFLVPNETAGEAFRSRYRGRVPVEVVGCPKTDDLLRLPLPDGPTVAAISFHWRASRIAPEADTALDHYRRDLERIAADLAGHGITLLGHGHPRIIEELEPIYARAGVELVDDFTSVLKRVHLYLVDNSSTGFEAAAAGRGVVWLNSPTYRRRRHHGLRFWEATKHAPTADGPADVVRCALAALQEPWLARRRGLARLAYAHLDGSATERAAMAILAASGRKCPICQAAACSCGPVDGSRGNPVIRQPTKKGQPLTVYRTARGDFRLSEESARRQGILPDGPNVPRQANVKLPFELVDDFANAYAGATDDARALVLLDIAAHRRYTPAQAARAIEELRADLAPAVIETTTEPADEDDPPISGRVGEVLAWAGDDEVRMRRAHRAEAARANPRITLLTELRNRLHLGPDEDV